MSIKRKHSSGSSVSQEDLTSTSQDPFDFTKLKVFNDPIHGPIEVHPLCINIIDTPQFQRLHYIKQLGCGYLVFPGAAHNRFEHSLGVCHLAGMFCRTLQKRQPELNITEKDILCVEIAGLCHDLGHGPFSHMFDQLFIPKVAPDSDWKHEEASVEMFQHLIDANQLKDFFAKYGLEDQDVIFIKELIIAKPLQQNNEPWPYTGRDKEKSYLYDIVANKRNGIDVDKWDYFLRDCHNLGISSSFDCHRYMKFSRVIKVDGKRQICARDKEVDNLYDMFYTRNSLHRRAYKHKATNILEIMLVEALSEANEHYKIKGKGGRMIKMSEAIDDMEAYTNMTDDIVLQIMRTDDKALAGSREILKKVQRRQLYKFIGKTQVPKGDLIKKKDKSDFKKKMMKDIEDMHGDQLKADQLIIDIVDLNYGKGKDNPIDDMRFYSKGEPDKAFPIPKGEVSHLLPVLFAEQQIRVYCKIYCKKYLEKVSECFQRWCDQYTVPKVSDPEITPSKPKKQKPNLKPEMNLSPKRIVF